MPPGMLGPPLGSLKMPGSVSAVAVIIRPAQAAIAPHLTALLYRARLYAFASCTASSLIAPTASKIFSTFITKIPLFPTGLEDFSVACVTSFLLCFVKTQIFEQSR